MGYSTFFQIRMYSHALHFSSSKILQIIIGIAIIAIIEGTAIFLDQVLYIRPLLIVGIERLLEIIMIIWVVMAREGGMFSIGLSPSTIIKGINKGLLWSFIFGAATGLVFLTLHFTGINPLTLIHSRLPENNKDLFLFLLVSCAIGPAAEELFFRGILYGFFRRWGIAAALIFSTIIFILAHNNIRSIPVTQAAGGIIFAISYEVEKSLMVPIVIHILGNAAIFILPFISQYP